MIRLEEPSGEATDQPRPMDIDSAHESQSLSDFIMTEAIAELNISHPAHRHHKFHLPNMENREAFPISAYEHEMSLGHCSPRHTIPYTRIIEFNEDSLFYPLT
jgi:hypothetical protein